MCGFFGCFFFVGFVLFVFFWGGGGVIVVYHLNSQTRWLALKYDVLMPEASDFLT